MIDISIVFVNLLMKDDIVKALRSLLADVQQGSYSWRITVADNSQNQDGIREALAVEFPQVHYLDCGGNIGFGAANNRAFQACQARYYFALNRDTLIPVHGQVLARIISFMDAHPRVGVMGPKLLNLDGSLQYSCYRFDWPSLLIKPLKQINWDEKYAWVRKYTDRLLMKDYDHTTARPVDWVLGAALIVRHEAVVEVGWFDERFFAYLEDCDWCRSMWEKNWSVYYVPEIVIAHAHARTSATVPGIFKALLKNKTARIHLASWCKYVWKWRGRFTL